MYQVIIQKLQIQITTLAQDISISSTKRAYFTKILIVMDMMSFVFYFPTIIAKH